MLETVLRIREAERQGGGGGEVAGHLITMINYPIHNENYPCA